MIARTRVTMRQVADEAGVSVQTVSRVVNDRPDVAPDTRKRVLRIINRLDYRPSNVARSLIQGRSRTIGVVGYGLEYVGPTRVLVGIEQQASEMDYTLLFCLMRQPEDDSAHVLRGMVAHHVDGIIWAVTEVGNNRDWARAQVDRLAVPVVFLHTDPRPDLTVVDVDNRYGGWLATRHLLDQGRHHIGLITGPPKWWAARERELGWRMALEENALCATQTLVAHGDWSPASGERGIVQLLERHPELDAVFACNDQMALGVLKAASDAGLRVPEDLAVVGFDDIPESAFFHPPLTTIHQDMNELGRCAVRNLANMITANQRSDIDIRQETIVLRPELVIRESTISGSR